MPQQVDTWLLSCEWETREHRPGYLTVTDRALHVVGYPLNKVGAVLILHVEQLLVNLQMKEVRVQLLWETR